MPIAQRRFLYFLTEVSWVACYNQWWGLTWDFPAPDQLSMDYSQLLIAKKHSIELLMTGNANNHNMESQPTGFYF